LNYWVHFKAYIQRTDPKTIELELIIVSFKFKFCFTIRISADVSKF
jgi:hypothetical protein